MFEEKSFKGVEFPFFAIIGPDVIEDFEPGRRGQTLRFAKWIKRISDDLDIPIIFKVSYDKANRTGIKSFRGPGLRQAQKIFREIKAETGLLLCSDVHDVADMGLASSILDVIQIPAFLSRQTDLLVAASATGKIINWKKGQFLAPHDVKYAIEKIEQLNKRIIITERGTTFGYNNLVVDMRSFSIMSEETGYPVLIDASHSIQLPGGMAGESTGERELIPRIAMAGIAAGATGVFLEAHENPEDALCDGPNMIQMGKVSNLIGQLNKIKTLTSKK